MKTLTLSAHQGLALSPYSFSIVMDKVTKDCQYSVLWWTMFADVIVLFGIKSRRS